MTFLICTFSVIHILLIPLDHWKEFLNIDKNCLRIYYVFRYRILKTTTLL